MHLLASLCFILVFSIWASAQASTAPSITFSLSFPGSDPENYVITVVSDGHASYDSDGKITSLSEPGNSTKLDFTLSESARKHIFDLASRAHYFEKEVDSKLKNLASTGKKTLAYKDGRRNTRVTYNYSPMPAVQELTQFFQNLSATLEYGRRLQFDHLHQKLALNEELTHMEDTAKQNGLEEIAVVAPVLQKIADDPSVMNVARNRALRLLAQASRPEDKK